MKISILLIFSFAFLASCSDDDIRESNYISVAGDNIFDPIVYAEEKVYCYGGYRFKVTIKGNLPDGTSVSFVLIADDLNTSNEIGIYEYEANTINSLCGENGTIHPYVNLVDSGFSNIGETFDIVGKVGMECKQINGSWKPIDADLHINLLNIPNPKK